MKSCEFRYHAPKTIDNPAITDEEILDVLSSNLCRCTGYQNIVKAVRSAAVEAREAGAG